MNRHQPPYAIPVSRILLNRPLQQDAGTLQGIVGRLAPDGLSRRVHRVSVSGPRHGPAPRRRRRFLHEQVPQFRGALVLLKVKLRHGQQHAGVQLDLGDSSRIVERLYRLDPASRRKQVHACGQAAVLGPRIHQRPHIHALDGVEIAPRRVGQDDGALVLAGRLLQERLAPPARLILSQGNFGLADHLTQIPAGPQEPRQRIVGPVGHGAVERLAPEIGLAQQQLEPGPVGGHRSPSGILIRNFGQHLFEFAHQPHATGGVQFGARRFGLAQHLAAAGLDRADGLDRSQRPLRQFLLPVRAPQQRSADRPGHQNQRGQGPDRRIARHPLAPPVQRARRVRLDRLSPEVPLKVVGKFASAAVPTRRVAFQALHHDRFDLARRPSVSAAQRHGVLVEHPVDHLQRRRSTVRRLSAQHVVRRGS